jgi:predicted nucleotidyltransferase
LNDNINISRIKTVHTALGELKDQVAFIGGAAVSLYKDRPTSEVRVTEDVDIVIEITTYAAFAIIEENLRKKGFINDIASKVICRYRVHGIIVDIMPIEEKILGFSNRWYRDGIRNSIDYSIDEHTQIRIFDVVHFLAAKIEAFNNRGNGDGRTSSDFEDIVYILNSRNKVWEELQNAQEEVKGFLKVAFGKLLELPYIYEWISAHLDYSEQKRASFIIEGLVDFTQS